MKVAAVVFPCVCPWCELGTAFGAYRLMNLSLATLTYYGAGHGPGTRALCGGGKRNGRSLPSGWP